MKLFKELRGAVVQNGITNYELAAGMGISQPHISQLLCGHSVWTLKEMYAAMDCLGLPYEKLAEYFPKGGHLSAADRKKLPPERKAICYEDDFDPDEIKQIEDYIDYIKGKRRKKQWNT